MEVILYAHINKRELVYIIYDNVLLLSTEKLLENHLITKSCFDNTVRLGISFCKGRHSLGVALMGGTQVINCSHVYKSSLELDYL